MADSTPKSAVELEKTVRTSASWCYWVAGMTTVNAAMAISGSDSGFVLGTIIAQAAMQMAREMGDVAKVIAAIFNVLAIAYFVGVGWLAAKGKRWAFVLGFLAYGADTLVLLLDPNFLAIAFHLWVLVSLGIGFVTVKKWREAQAAEAVAATPPALAPVTSPDAAPPALPPTG
jgi:hypothetical protein